MTRPAFRLNFPTRIAEALLAFSARRRGLLYSILGLVAVLGVAALQRLPRDLPPAALAPTVVVEVNDPGMPAPLMESRVTQPLERSLTAVAGVAGVSSTTVEGRSTVEVQFPPATDLPASLGGIRERLAQIDLPRSVDAPKIVAPAATPAVELVLVSGSRSPAQLRAWAEGNLVSQLVSLPGVASTHLAGGGEREIHVIPDQRRLAGAGLALGSLVRALRMAGNAPVSATASKMAPASASALAALPLRLASGESVALGEVARVEEQFEPGTAGVLRQGLAGIRIDVIPQAGEPPGDVAQRVGAHLSWMRVNGLVPESSDLSTAFDAHAAVRASLAESHRAALTGFVFLVLIVVAALRRPVEILVTLAMIPFAVLTGAAILYAGGQALDARTYAGLALGAVLALGFALRSVAIGAATVRRRPVEEFITAGVVAVPTVAVALVGFALAAGPVGQLYRGLLLAIAGSFAGGVFFAFSLIPAVLAGRGSAGPSHPVSSFLDRRQVRWRPTRGHRVLILLGLVAAVVVLWGVARQMPGATAVTRAALEYALPETEVAARSADVEREARRLDNVRAVYTVTRALPTVPGSVRHVILRTQIEIEGGDNGTALASLRDRLEKRGVTAALRLTGRDGDLNLLRVTASGSDARELTVLGAALAGRMTGVTGIHLLPEPLPPLVPDIVLRLDAVRADALGIDPVEAERVLRILRSMPVVSELAGSEGRVRVRLLAPPEETGSGSGKVLLAGELSDRPLVYLRDIAQVEPAVMPAEIRHRDGMRSVSIGATLAPGLSPARALATMRVELERATLPPGHAPPEIALTRAAIDGTRPLAALAATVAIYSLVLGYRVGRRRLPSVLAAALLMVAAGGGLVLLPAAGGQVAGAWVALLLLATLATVVWLVAGEIAFAPREVPPARRLAAWRAGFGAMLAMVVAALILWLLAPLGEARQTLGATLLLGVPAVLAGVLLVLSAGRGRR